MSFAGYPGLTQAAAVGGPLAFSPAFWSPEPLPLLLLQLLSPLLLCFQLLTAPQPQRFSLLAMTTVIHRTLAHL